MKKKELSLKDLNNTAIIIEGKNAKGKLKVHAVARFIDGIFYSYIGDININSSKDIPSYNDEDWSHCCGPYDIDTDVFDAFDWFIEKKIDYLILGGLPVKTAMNMSYNISVYKDNKLVYEQDISYGDCA